MNMMIPEMTMTSREIAELTGKRHDNVLRDIKVMATQLGTLNNLRLEYRGRINNLGLPVKDKHYLLDKEESFCLVAGYDANVRMKIIKRWQELEAAAPKLPQTFAEALRLAADIEMERERLAIENAEQHKVIALAAPKVAVFDNIVDTAYTHSLTDAAKVLGLQPLKVFIPMLKGMGWLTAKNLATTKAVQHGYMANVIHAHGEQGRLTVEGLGYLSNVGEE